jgi:hypothetical protein
MAEQKRLHEDNGGGPALFCYMNALLRRQAAGASGGSHMFGTVERIIDKLRLRWLLVGYIVWICFFGVIYYWLAILQINTGLISEQGEFRREFLDSLLFSFATATSSDVSGLLPAGHAKWLSVLEVFGGILFAGLAINLLAVMPSKKTRIAEKACRGWWIEEITIPRVQKFYSISFMTRSGDVIRKYGRNYHPNGGQMDGTTYQGRLSAYDFPVLISHYQNDTLSKEYTDGFLRFEMNISSDGTYNSYNGMSFDRKHGGRDRIVGRRITDPIFLDVLETRGILDDRQHEQLVSENFGSLRLDTPS